MVSIDKKGHLNSSWNPKIKGKGSGRRRVRVQDFTTDSEELVGLVVGENRIKIASILEQLGVDSFLLRAGFGSDTFAPSDDELRISSVIAKEHPDRAVAICGPTKGDLERVIGIGARSVVIQTTTSDDAIKYRLKKPLSALIGDIVGAIDAAASRGIKVTYMASDSTRSNPKTLRRILKAVKETRCQGLVLSDSNGCATPEGISRHVRSVKSWTRLPIGVHCHDDYGLATANALAGAEAGADFVHTCAAGVGERAGLAAMEEVALGLDFLLGMDSGIKLSDLTRSCNAIAPLMNYSVPFKKPIIGSAALGFDGERLVTALEDLDGQESRLLMLPYLPDLVGNQVHVFLAGDIGVKSVWFRLKRIGKSASDDDLKEIALRCSETAMTQRREVDDEQLLGIYEKVIRGSGRRRPPPDT